MRSLTGHLDDLWPYAQQELHLHMAGGSRNLALHY